MKQLHDGRYGIALRLRGGRWQGDFRPLGDKQKALSYRLAGELGGSRGVPDLDEAKRIAGIYARKLKLAADK